MVGHQGLEEGGQSCQLVEERALNCTPEAFYQKEGQYSIVTGAILGFSAFDATIRRVEVKNDQMPVFPLPGARPRFLHVLSVSAPKDRRAVRAAK